MRSLAVLACLAGTLLSTQAAQAAVIAAQPEPVQLITNGSFENGMNGWSRSGSGTTPGIGVVVLTTGGQNTTGYGDNVPNFDGTHAAYFVDDNASEALYQNITLAAQTVYRFSYALFATASGAANPLGFTLYDGLYNGSTMMTVGIDTDATVPVGAWTTYSRDFTVGSAGVYAAGFLFQSGATPAKDVLLDAVSITTVPRNTAPPTAVPEPMSLALLGAGLAGVAISRRKRA